MEELDEIRANYEAGQLDRIKADLERFILSHRAAILKLRDANAAKGRPPLADELAIKFYILRHRSINPAQEIQEQLVEIEREKWIRGVRTGHEPDAQEVAVEWAKEHSAGWRAHRVTTIVYVFDRDKDRYLKLLA